MKLGAFLLGVALVGPAWPQTGTGSEKEWRIEGFAIECDQRLRWRQKLRDRLQHGRLLRRIAHEELAQHELPIHKARDPHEESIRSCAARQTRCLGIDKGKPGERNLCQARVVGPLRN